ncbi:MAG: inorganic phosphate transporter [Proteobacteria bacterium]|nr:inorganic phosphate transporter [Pseudomonadota bacterium]
MTLPLSFLIITLVFGLYSAWNIGANDVANAMGTSVGSRALTFKKAVILAGICEFLGAVLVGSHVTDTIRKGIVDPLMFSGNPEHLAYGMLAALISSAIFLNLSTLIGMPVSTTHSIVGAVAGFGLIKAGVHAVYWSKLLSIALSWMVAPLIGAIAAFFVFKFISRKILSKPKPYEKAVFYSPYLVFAVIFVLTLSIIYKGPRHLFLDMSLGDALLVSSLLGMLALLAVKHFFQTRTIIEGIADEYLSDEYRRVEKIFAFLQIITACCVAFAHGANDVANAIGPVAAIVSIAKTNAVAMQVEVPIGILLLGGVGIVFGLATFGYRVIETIGKKITEITPSRGFSAEFATATTVLFCSKMGLPISTTHTLVGAVIGVGFARGIAVLDFGIVKKILWAWLITIPLSALMTIIIFKLLTFIY